jgi:Fe-Mn family superoxide dismutase
MTSKFVLPPLPYPEDALAPFISSQTIEFHYGKHHKAYVDTLNKLIANTEFEDQTLETIIVSTAGKSDRTQIFNNAAQAWNHAFYWQSLTPKAEHPSGTLADKFAASFASPEAFEKEFSDAAISQFGSGWAWLVADGDTLKIVKTGNAEVPFTRGLVPLLTIDVWEHAYYLDYQNRRPDYVKTVISSLLCWDFAARNLEKGRISAGLKTSTVS